MSAAGLTARLRIREYRPTERTRRCGSVKSTIIPLRVGSPISP
jgi:hypothetical protein